MKLKNLLVLAAFAAAAQVNAANYYVVPGTTATGNNGSSWESAITLWDIYANEATAKKVADNSKYKSGDVFFFAGGTYYPTVTPGGIADRIYRGYIFVGGCDQTKGAVTEWPTYPSATPTIFSGDLNNDGIASPGDAQNLVYMRKGAKLNADEGDRYTLAEADLKPLTFYGFEFKCAYNENEWPSSESADNLKGWGAVNACQGWVELYNCTVHDTYAQKASGVCIYGSLYRMTDCTFYNNVAEQTGAALRVNINTSERYSRGVVERCSFYNNTLNDKFGAGIALTAGEMYIVNTTITGNTAYAEGAGVVANGDKDASRKFHIINSTIAGNICTADPADLYKTDTETGAVTNPGSLVGTDVRIAADANFDMFNSIVVGLSEDGTVAYAPFVMKDAAKGASNPKCDFTGFNLTGSVMPLIADDKWTYITEGSYNYLNATNTFEAVFGEQDGSEKGYLVPNATYLASLSETEKFYVPYVGDIISYGLLLKEEPLFTATGFTAPDLTVDQLGKARNSDEAADYCVGAIEIFNETGINAINAKGEADAKVIFNLAGQRINSLKKGVNIVSGKKVIL